VATALAPVIEEQLRQVRTGDACVFSFIWQIMLMLLAHDCGNNEVSATSQELRLQAALVSAGRKAHLLDAYSERLIDGLALGSLQGKAKTAEQETFVAWARKKVLALSRHRGSLPDDI
jgi:hypothetical protein